MPALTAARAQTLAQAQTLEDLIDHLGSIPPSRILLHPAPGLVRIPDVCFLSWDHFPNRKLPRKPIPDLAPDLAVEVLSESNTEPEMQRKLEEYFARVYSDARLVWYVQPDDRTVRVYHGPEEITTLGEDDTLDGGDLLPGFRLSIREWFERAGDRQDD